MQIVSDKRFSQLQSWLAQQHMDYTKITPINADASMRRYFRLVTANKPCIAMDAPPETENNQAFVAVAQCLHQHQLAVPQILAQDLSQGFLLLSDLGTSLYYDLLDKTANADLYRIAIDAICQMQGIKQVEYYQLPYFDEAFIKIECDRFVEWYCRQLLIITLNEREVQAFNEIFKVLTANALNQPQVFVHRDYHACNLLQVSAKQVGILDFQDAIWGPISYDLVALLKDCRRQIKQDCVDQWVKYYWTQATQRGLLQTDLDTFTVWFDKMGLQLHLKILGIFARLAIRDNKSSYLQYMPNLIQLIESCCHKYPEFAALHDFFKQYHERVHQVIKQ